MPRKQAGRAPNGAGSIRKKTVVRNGKEYLYYEARITTGYDPLTGKQKVRSVTGKTQKEVRQALTKITAEVDSGTYIEPSKQTVGEWLDIWLDTYVTASVKPYTEHSYRGICKNHIIPVLGNVKLSTLTAPQVQQLYNLLRQSGLNAKTIKNVHGVIHKALSQAVKVGSIRFNPADACELPKVYQKEITPLEENEISLLLIAIRGDKYERVYIVTLFVGLRQGEVLGLTWDCVDFENNTLYINKQLQKNRTTGEYELVPTKNGKARLITVAPSVMEVLKAQKLNQEQMRRIAGTQWDNKDNLVFTNEIGGHLVHVTVYKHFKKIVRSIGLDETRFHDLRHSYAVTAIECGDDIKTVQTNLGHATAAFTLNTYAHTTQKMRQQSANRMENFIQSVSGK